MVLDLSGFNQTWRLMWNVSTPLILREVFSTFDKKPLGIFKCGHMTKLGAFCSNEYLSQGWLGLPLSKLRWSNSNLIIIKYHLKLREGVHIFRLDLTLFNFEVYSFTLTRLKVSTQSVQNLKIEWRLIRDKMLGTSMEKLGCKRLISWKRSCRRDVPLPFAKYYMPFDGLELYNKLLKGINLIIANC
jgi:hypothetical protein